MFRMQNIGISMVMLLAALIVGIVESTGGEASSSLQLELEQAREKWRVSQAVRDRTAADLERLKASGRASQGTIADYERYLEQVDALVRENRSRVVRLEALRDRQGKGAYAGSGHGGSERKAGFDPDIPETAVPDPVADLDRQLDESLESFDAALLKEMELIRIQSAEKEKALTDNVEATRQRLKAQGIDVDAEGGSEARETSRQQDADPDSRDRRKNAEDRPESGSDAASAEKERPGSAAGEVGASPKKRGADTGAASGMSEEERRRYGSGEDDDIVARQLREAAESESDPKLREKLWKEYEDYKNNQR